MFDEEAKDSRSASLHVASGSSSGAGSGFGESYSLSNPSIHAGEEIPQPTIFNGKLKGYQLKGMNWLANLYEQVRVLICGVREPSGTRTYSNHEPQTSSFSPLSVDKRNIDGYYKFYCF